MATATQRRRKADRRRAHAQGSDHRTGYSSIRQVEDEVALMRLQVKAVLDAVPGRAKCPDCGFSQKVRKDGTMSRHDVWNPTKNECSGTGRNYQA